MRLKRFALIAAGGGLIAVGFAVPSQAGLTTFCDGVASDVTVPGDLVVRAGASCELTNVTITGNATVRADANLLLEGSTVEGALRVNNNGYASVIDTDLQATRLNAAFGVYSEDSSHERNVVASDSEFFYTLGSSFARNVVSTNVETFLESSQVSMNVSSEGGLLTDVYDSVVSGDVSIAGTELGSVFCLSEVDGAATFSGNAGLVQLGGTDPVSDCGFNVFGADLTLTDNTADSSVNGNVVRGDLVCSDNDPAPVVSDNRVRGEENCDAGAAAAASKLSSNNGFSAAASAVEARKAEVAKAVAGRSAAGSDAAEEAGDAFE